MARSFPGSAGLGVAFASISPPWTVGLLIRNATDPGTDTIICDIGGVQFRWQQWTNDGQLGITIPGVEDYFGTGVPSPTGSAWAWIALTKIDASNARLRSGTSKYEFTTVSFAGSATGIGVNNAGQGVSVEIAEVALWSVALSDAEAADLVGLKLPNCVQASNLRHWWKLASPTLPDPDEIGAADLDVVDGTTTIVTHPTMVACGGGGGSAIPAIVQHLRQQGVM